MTENPWTVPVWYDAVKTLFEVYYILNTKPHKVLELRKNIIKNAIEAKSDSGGNKVRQGENCQHYPDDVEATCSADAFCGCFQEKTIYTCRYSDG